MKTTHPASQKRSGSLSYYCRYYSSASFPTPLAHDGVRRGHLFIHSKKRLFGLICLSCKGWIQSNCCKRGICVNLFILISCCQGLLILDCSETPGRVRRITECKCSCARCPWKRATLSPTSSSWPKTPLPKSIDWREDTSYTGPRLGREVSKLLSAVQCGGELRSKSPRCPWFWQPVIAASFFHLNPHRTGTANRVRA